MGGGDQVRVEEAGRRWRRQGDGGGGRIGWCKPIAGGAQVERPEAGASPHLEGSLCALLSASRLGHRRADLTCGSRDIRIVHASASDLTADHVTFRASHVECSFTREGDATNLGASG